MRKQRIVMLHRTHRKPPEPSLFYRSHRDPEGMLRQLINPGLLLPIAEVEERWNLEPENPHPKKMSMMELAKFVGQVGPLADDDPARLHDEGNDHPTTRVDSDGTTHRISDDQVIFTIPFKKMAIVDPDSGRTINMRVANVDMYRGTSL